MRALMPALMRQPRRWSRITRNVALGAAISVLLLGFFTISNTPYTTRPLVQCPYDDVAGNVVVAVKTGATEASERVEVLMQTTLRCAKHVLFFSDLEQDIGPYHLHDALQTISPSVMEDPVFEFYHRQRELWKTEHNVSSLKGAKDPSKPDDLAAWSLDKYKNMHIVEKTWELKPDRDWYVFIDADTYLVWSNLLRWLSSLDSTKRGFFGSKLVLSDTNFMHGGSGMVMSKTTVHDFAVTNNGTAARWDPRIRWECCGDYVLSRALVEYGNELSNVWPSISGQKPCTFPYSLSESYWCQPTVTMHHVSPSEMRQFSDFERQRSNQSVSRSSSEIAIAKSYILTGTFPLDTCNARRDLRKPRKGISTTNAHTRRSSRGLGQHVLEE